ncbi:MAG: hypothetical protein IPK21_10535 [Haliscomenobacter sp.]|nr:hypothetical protein [Haliscomenobacter sp.]
MKQFTIEGKVVFQDIEDGIWGITGADGAKWLPVHFPSSLKKKGLKVRVIAQERDDMVSSFQWGTPIRILSFQILK